MKRYEFTGTNELSERAFAVYSDSSFTFYKEGETFYVAYTPKDEASELGTLADVEEFLLQFYEDDEEG